MTGQTYITVLDPIAPPASATTKSVYQPLDDLRGKVVGFIDNSKPNFSYLIDDLAEFLQSRYGVAGVVKHRKLSASRPAADAVVADVAEKCDLVITGSGD